jgi:enoyl-CoA hydratase
MPKNGTLVRVERAEGVATFTLDRPESLNALSSALCEQLRAAFDGVKDDEDVRAVILTGAGRAFCAGVDLKELSGEATADGAPVSRSPMGALAACRQPVIAAINGLAVTGGLELALGCDVLIASSEARFADTHARAGLVPQWGLTQRLPRLIGASRARQLSFTGNFVDAGTAERWGLVSQVVAPDELMAVCRALAHDIATCPAGAVQTIKRIYDETAAIEDGMRRELELSRAYMKTVSLAGLAETRKQVQARGRKQSGSR